MNEIHTIATLDDPRVAGYRNMRERDLRAEGVFIAEGALLAERLLHSRFPVESILVAAESKARFAAQLQTGVPLYVAEAELLRQIVGFDFHRGVLALGRRLPFPAPACLIPQLTAAAPDAALRLIACPGTESDENLGLILRSAAAFGVQGVLLPETGADPLSRRCLRQSMGSALSLPIARSADLLHELDTLRQTHGLRLVAGVAEDNSKQFGSREVIPLPRFQWPERAVLVVGNEFRGLDVAWLDRCDYHVTIPLTPNCDSLNVAVATGVLLFHMSSTSTAGG